MLDRMTDHVDILYEMSDKIKDFFNAIKNGLPSIMGFVNK